MRYGAFWQWRDAADSAAAAAAADATLMDSPNSPISQMLATADTHHRASEPAAGLRGAADPCCPPRPCRMHTAATATPPCAAQDTCAIHSAEASTCTDSQAACVRLDLEDDDGLGGDEVDIHVEEAEQLLDCLDSGFIAQGWRRRGWHGTESTLAGRQVAKWPIA